jgi:arylformamidase
MYNNRALVPDHADYFARWAEESRRARGELRCELDIPYGSAAGETLDVFPAEQGDGPVLVFVHGGYWRSLDKADHSFIAPAFTRHNTCVVVPNYTLAPAVTIPQITMQVARAVAWTWHNARRFGGDPRRIVVAGHSAGGHLAAMLLACLWQQMDAELPRDAVRSALSISGLHDLDPIRRTPFLQATLQLTPEQVEQASPAQIARATAAAVASPSGPPRSRSASDSPSSSSIVRYGSGIPPPSCTPRSWMRHTLGCVIVWATCTSRRNRSSAAADHATSRCSVLSATRVPSTRSSASYTAPIPPIPRRPTILWRAASTMPGRSAASCARPAPPTGTVSSSPEGRPATRR